MSEERSLNVSNTELFTIRDAMRGLHLIVDRFESGGLDKAVLMRGKRMVALVLPIAAAVEPLTPGEALVAADALDSAEDDIWIGRPAAAARDKLRALSVSHDTERGTG